MPIIYILILSLAFLAYTYWKAPMIGPDEEL